MAAIKYVPKPLRIKVAEPLKMLIRRGRKQAIAQARYGMFGLKGEGCYIGLPTGSGTNAMGEDQRAGIMRGNEAYAGASFYYKLVDVVKDTFGCGYVQPVHRGCTAEEILFPTLLSGNKVTISNMLLDTTRTHIILADTRPVDCVILEAKDPSHRYKFRGNMDAEKLEQIILEKGVESIGLVIATITNDSTGGQSVSLQSMGDVSVIYKKYNISLDISVVRYAENAYFVGRDEGECKDWLIKKIIKEIFSLADMLTTSTGKDTIVSMGGMIEIKNEESPLIPKMRADCTSLEGFYTHGGLDGHGLEALATGLYEDTNKSYLRHRVGQMEYLTSRLDDVSTAYQAPVGDRGVFVDAAAMFPQVPCYKFPGQVLAIELYKKTGIHAYDIGSYMLGSDPDTDERLHADFKFTHLAIPCRVYTRAYIGVMTDALIVIKERTYETRHGYGITWEPPVLRHFQASLEPIED